MKIKNSLTHGLSSFLVLMMGTLSVQAEVLEVSAEEQRLLGIEVQEVRMAASGETAELTLRVGFSPDGEWAIKTPFPGILYRAFVQVGDHVSEGDALMTVRSPEVVVLQREYLKARAELNLQESVWARDKKLSDAGSISGRRWQETRYAHDTAKAEFAGLRAELMLAGFSDEGLQRLSQEMEVSPGITLRAPADAIVLERPAMLGDHLEGTELLARLGQPDKLILEGILSSSAVAHLDEGMQITRQSGDNQAVLVMVSNVIDPKTQTVRVRAEPLGLEGLIPGQLTRWSVKSGGSLLTVPSSAVVKLEGIDVAYVQLASGFEPREVEVRSTGSGQWIVLNGLSAGDRVAVRGTAVLKGMSVGMGGGDG
jgi:cobalt-zinc-cadmium efflux system membrane fusion protein